MVEARLSTCASRGLTTQLPTSAGPREVLLTSDEPVVWQFLNRRRVGPIGMSEEKDES